VRPAHQLLVAASPPRLDSKREQQPARDAFQAHALDDDDEDEDEDEDEVDCNDFTGTSATDLRFSPVAQHPP
jgi:hypothetical protein